MGGMVPSSLFKLKYTSAPAKNLIRRLHFPIKTPIPEIKKVTNYAWGGDVMQMSCWGCWCFHPHAYNPP